jgi:imidazolonepropionase
VRSVTINTMQAPIVIAPVGELHTLDSSSGARKGKQMSETGKLQNAGLVIQNGYIQEAGSANEIIDKYPHLLRMNCANKLITPGLIDSHTHLVWAGSRANEFLRRCRGETYEEIAKQGGGIISTTKAVREADVEELAQGIIKRANEVLRCGTTTIEIKASYGHSFEACKKELDAIALAKKHIKQRIVVTFMGAHSIPKDVNRKDFIIEICEKWIPMANEHEADVKFNDVFCEVGAYDLNESELILRSGIKHNLTPKIHADEFNVLGGVELACELNAASCDHLLMSGEKQIHALANSHTIAVLLPGTAFYLNKTFAKGRQMIDAGCAVAIGTDYNPGSSVVASLPFCMGLAVTRMGLTPEEALTAVTINANHALRNALPEKTGTLTKNAPADLCIWDVPALDDLVYNFSHIQPEKVMINGEWT